MNYNKQAWLWTMERSQTCHLINKSNTLFCKCSLTFGEAIISLWKKKKEGVRRKLKDINVILLKYVKKGLKSPPHIGVLHRILFLSRVKCIIIILFFNIRIPFYII
jgi:hypothetical protein